MKKKYIIYYFVLFFSIAMFVCSSDETEKQLSQSLTTLGTQQQFSTTVITTTTTTTLRTFDSIGPDYSGEMLLVCNVDGNMDGNYEGIESIPGSRKINMTAKKGSTKLSPEAYLRDNVLPSDIEEIKKYSNLSTSRSLVSGTTECSVGESCVFRFYYSYEVEATKTAEGDHCMIFTNSLQNVSYTQSQTVVEEFDDIIWDQIVIPNFGQPSDVDTNGKIIILYVDMGMSGLGGFFSPTDLYNSSYGNNAEVVYINSNPYLGGIDSVKSVGIVAHEFQHMVNYNQNIFLEGGNEQDIWINEGLSEASNDLYIKAKGEKSLSYRVDYYNSDVNDTIKNGHALCIWDDGSGGDVLANYTLSYLFFQYIRIHSENGEQIFKTINEGVNNDYKDIEEAIKSKLDVESFEELLVNWRIANVLQEETGIYGYGSESSDYQLEFHQPSKSTVTLGPGGAIVKTLDALFIPKMSYSNVRFIGFSSK